MCQYPNVLLCIQLSDKSMLHSDAPAKHPAANQHCATSSGASASHPHAMQHMGAVLLVTRL